MLDEVTAMPNMLVRGQRADMENVMAIRLVVGDDGVDVDLHHHLGARERLDHEAGGDRKDALEVAADDPVDVLAVARVGEVDGDLADVLELAAGLLEELLDAFHGVVGLGGRVADADHLAVEGEAGLAAHEDVVAGAHHHAEVVVEALLGVHVLGVELAQALVRHGRCLPLNGYWSMTRSDRPALRRTNSSGWLKSKLR